MKRQTIVLTMLICITLIMSCASLPQDSPERAAAYRLEVEAASRILLERAVQGASEKLRLEPSRPASYMMPEIRTMFIDNSSITGMENRVQTWENLFKVVAADIATTIPSHLQEDVHAFTIPHDVDASALARGSVTAVQLFENDIRASLVTHIADMARQGMDRTDADGNTITALWNGIKNSYRIWTEAWERIEGPWRPSLPGIWSETDQEILEALAEAMADDFLVRLATEEEIIRSTPIADDADPVALIFQTP